jgi:uncharacterized protein (UPF0276 family)
MSLNGKTRSLDPIPAEAGIGLRARHYREILEERPKIGWLEVHSENFFSDGGQPLYYLEKIRDHYPLSLHGVGLVLGSTDPLNWDHLDRLKSLIDRFEPDFVSEHLCWGSVQGRFLNDLLPLPYTEQALDHFCRQVQRAQEFIGRTLLIENVCSYLEFKQSTIPEWEFIAEVAKRTGCGLLLDVNNIYVNSVNHKFDPEIYFQSLPPNAVREIHLAGFDDSGDCLIDTHGKPVFAEVWELYRQAVKHFGETPTLIEWDTDIPELSVLLAEAWKADAILMENHAHIA